MFVLYHVYVPNNLKYMNTCNTQNCECGIGPKKLHKYGSRLSERNKLC